MEEQHLLGELLLLIAIATAGVALFERLRLPAIAGFLVMGTLVGPGGLGLVSDPERVRALAEFGVVFLLFEIGLELPVERLRRMWRVAVVAGGLQVSVTLACVFAAGRAFGLEPATAFVMGGLVAMSSTALVMRLLSERGEVDAPQGQLAVGILLFQDLCIVPLLLAVPILAGGQGSSAWPVALAVLRAVVALGAFFVAARFVLPPLLDRVARLRSPDLFSLLTLLVVVGSAVVAEELGLTFAVGAFIAGLVMSASPYASQLFAEIVPLRSVLLGLFFTAVGMLLAPVDALRAWPQVLLYVAGVVVLKAGVLVAVVTFALRQGLRLGLLTGLALAQTGEFSFVLAAAAGEAGLLGASLQQTFVAGSVLTLLATPFLVVASPHVARWLGARGELRAGRASGHSQLQGHAVLVGFGAAGRTLARVLRALETPYVILEGNPTAVQEALAQGEPIVYGDVSRPAVLERVGLPRARMVVVAISDPIATRRAVELARSLAPQATILARARYVLDVDELQSAGANVVVAEEYEATLDLLAEALRVSGFPESSIARFSAELREEGYEPLRAAPALRFDPWLLELLEQVATEWLEVPQAYPGNATLVELGVRARTGASILAVDRGGMTTPHPDPSFEIAAGDRLLVYGSPAALGKLRELLLGRRVDA